MSHCHDEHAGHGHDGHDHSEGAAHDHTDDLTPALQYSLYQHIDFDNITANNESPTGAGKAIVKKTWDERMSPNPLLKSLGGAKLLLRIPFTGQVRLHSIFIRSSTSSDAPKTLKLYINRDDLDTSSASDLDPIQEFEIPQANEVQEIPVKRAKFSRVQSLTLFIQDNYSCTGDEDSDDSDFESDDEGEGEGGGDREGVKKKTKISYLGFKGDWMPLGKAPTNILYEAAANPNDHKIKGTSVNQMGSRLG